MPGWRFKVALVVETAIVGGHLVFHPHCHGPEGHEYVVKALTGQVDLPNKVIDVQPGG